MSEVNAQLRAIREGLDLSRREMAEAIGMPGTSYAAYEDPRKFKKRYLPMDMAKRLAAAVADRGGDGDAVLALAGVSPGNAAIPDPHEAIRNLGFGLVPELELGYSMGGGSVFHEYRRHGLVPFPMTWLRRLMAGNVSDLFVARGEGDSMQPTLLDGDVMLIDTAQRHISKQDRIWAVSYGDLGMIKRVRRLPDGSFTLMSDNHSVADLNAVEDEIHVIGRVVWIGRRI